ncbi:tRNA lysidine(34) synthetase TilS [Desulfitobacterium sp. AusDCA]|uniref:tRNA lysidine(34) synthetase TilS n=1 Tax=Desulfitobacterium sp. AusDCA TaxID=3240383 RepID=UPI003DA72B81
MIYEKMRQTILPQLLPRRARILVAVSGGPDSMALSHVLWRYAQEYEEQEISLVLTHVHHGVRSESDEEALMVQEMAAQWGIPFIIHRFDAKAYAAASGQSFEAAAREWRYARWKEDLKQYNCDLLATAHHLGDQAETILYRLLRGSGTAGLAGIYPQKGRIIRPFLTLKKEELLEYCQEEQIPYAVDYTNFQPLFVRNRIRLELLPELKKNYNPKILETIGRTAEVLRWDEEYLEQQTDKAWSSYCLFDDKKKIQLSTKILQEPKAILSRLVRRAAAHITGEPRGLGFGYVNQIIDSKGQVGWKQDLPNFTVHIRYDGIWFLDKELDKNSVRSLNPLTDEFEYRDKEIPVCFEQWCEASEVRVGVFLIEGLDLKWMNEKALIATADFDQEELLKRRDNLVLRYRKEGDTLWIRGVGNKTLKKVFQEAKINSEMRRKMLLLAYKSEILWIPGVKQSDSCLVGEGPKVRVMICRKTKGKADL